MHANQNGTDFLGRVEFYNALKLVTVAQRGRELTPDIVKAALFGPAAAKIPAPRINSAATPTPQLNSVRPPASQMSAVAPATSQNLGFRGPQALQSAGMNQQFFPSLDNQFIRPPQASPAPSLLMQATGQGLPGAGNVMGPRLPNSNSSNLSTDWFGARPAGTSMGAMPQAPNRGVSPSMTQDGFSRSMPSGSTPLMPPRPQASSGLTPSVPSTQDGYGGKAPSGSTFSVPPRPQAPSGQMPSLPSKPQDPVPSLQSAVKDSKALTASGNGFSSDSIFGGDVFSVTPSQPKQAVSTQNLPASSAPISSATVPVATETQSSVKQGQVDPFQSFAMTVTTSQLQHPVTQAKTAPAASVAAAGSASGQTQLQWPKITESDIQKYTKVFVEVDTDRDGKITGEQARNLFLSWRLPRGWWCCSFMM